MTALEARDLEVRYGKLNAVTSVSFTVEPGSALAILGRNGAGKSSLLAALAGLVRPSRGQVLVDGVDVTPFAADRRARSGLTLVPEGRRIFRALTVEENLRLGGFWSEPDRLVADVGRVTRLFPVLAEKMASPAGHMSGGEQQMLAIGRALMSRPRVLLLDEPSLGLAPRAVADVYAQLAVLREEGLTIVVVEQQVRRALGFAADAMVLHEGSVAAHEEPGVLLDDPRLLNAYMGGSRPT
ncbi:MAG TPA: ABC transporter ATP-binding protein [Acidimicrobiia bacterium]|jgi:branched-chain amino acid transport system ATP-binding protein|nr:ABC transporter ATP-binding protein [Acidimicrobiia bacterium]